MNIKTGITICGHRVLLVKAQPREEYKIVNVKGKDRSVLIETPGFEAAVGDARAWGPTPKEAFEALPETVRAAIESSFGQRLSSLEARPWYHKLEYDNGKETRAETPALGDSTPSNEPGAPNAWTQAARIADTAKRTAGVRAVKPKQPKYKPGDRERFKLDPKTKYKAPSTECDDGKVRFGGVEWGEGRAVVGLTDKADIVRATIRAVVGLTDKADIVRAKIPEGAKCPILHAEEYTTIAFPGTLVHRFRATLRHCIFVSGHVLSVDVNSLESIQVDLGECDYPSWAEGWVFAAPPPVETLDLLLFEKGHGAWACLEHGVLSSVFTEESNERVRRQLEEEGALDWLARPEGMPF
jgi:hypothetical protein